MPDAKSIAFASLKMEETQEIIRQLLEGLRVAGLVAIVWHPKSENEVPGYQLKTSAILVSQ